MPHPPPAPSDVSSRCPKWNEQALRLRLFVIIIIAHKASWKINAGASPLLLPLPRAASDAAVSLRNNAPAVPRDTRNNTSRRLLQG